MAGCSAERIARARRPDTEQYRRLNVQDGGELSGDVRAFAEPKETAPVRKLGPPANDRRDEKPAKAQISGLREGKTLRQRMLAVYAARALLPSW